MINVSVATAGVVSILIAWAYAAHFEDAVSLRAEAANWFSCGNFDVNVDSGASIMKVSLSDQNGKRIEIKGPPLHISDGGLQLSFSEGDDQNLDTDHVFTMYVAKKTFQHKSRRSQVYYSKHTYNCTGIRK